MEDRDSDVRDFVIKILGNMALPLRQQFPALIKALEDKYTQISAIQTLGKIGPSAQAAVPALIKALEDKYTQISAIQTLGKIGPSAQRKRSILT
jgi:HEAT repeat protein